MASKQEGGPVRVSLIRRLGMRSIAQRKDAYMLNGMPSKYGNDVVFARRPGFTGFGAAVGGSTTQLYAITALPAQIAGSTFPVLGLVEGDPSTPTVATVSVQTVLGLTLIANQTWTNGYPAYGTSMIMMPDYATVFMHSNRGAAVISNLFSVTPSFAALNTGIWQIPGGIIPASGDVAAPGLALLDGYLFIMTQFGRVYNCFPGDPTQWNPVDFIKLSSDNDFGSGIARHMNFVIAFTRQTMTPLYNAGTPSPGSPLAPYQSAVYNVGCVDGRTIAGTSDYLFWVGRGTTGGDGVYMLEPGSLVPQRVSTPAVEAFLQMLLPSQVTPADMPPLVGYSFNTQGRVLYCVNQPQYTSGLPQYPTLVYDTLLKDWYIWSYDETGATLSGMPFNGATGLGDDLFFSTGQNGVIYQLDDGPQDATLPTGRTDPVSKPMWCEVQTDWDVLNNYSRAMIERAVLMGDLQTAGKTAQLSYSDDDFATFTTPRNLPLDRPRAETRNLGSSYRRAWRLSYLSNSTAPTPLRFQELQFTASGGLS